MCLELSDDEVDEDEYDTEENEMCEHELNCALQCLDDALTNIESAEEKIQKAEEDVKDFASFMKFDQVEQSEIRQRVRQIEKLFKDFDCTSSEELLDLASETQSRLDQYFDSCHKRTNWESQLASLEEEYIKKSVYLSLARREVAGKLRKAIEDCLYDLAMQQSRFDVRVNWEHTTKSDGVYITSEAAIQAGERGDARYHATAKGFDSIEFLLAPGRSEPLKSLSGVASGGECARVMLAFKVAPMLVVDGKNLQEQEVSDEAGSAVLVLDELDTGVGVRLGRTVGRLLKSISTSDEVVRNQVICVSHLPQVAAYASTHIKATKTMDSDGRMEIQFHRLDDTSERRVEIKAMLGQPETVTIGSMDDIELQ